MSMPKIPDITPRIDITLEDSVNLLLSSIALEEISLSKLMDAEKKKISFVLCDCQNNKANVEDVLDINESVNNTIKNLIKMQMLLQFKLEDVKKLIPTTCISRSKCCIEGEGRGVVSNKSDEFHCQNVTLSVLVSSCDCMDNTIHYHVGNDRHNSLCMKVEANDIKIECPCAMQHNEIKIWGKGKLTKILECHNINMNVNFKLLISNIDGRIDGFKMIIQACENPVVVHDSGFVKVCCCKSCCNTCLKLVTTH